MRFTQPKVYLIASTELRRVAVIEWLKALGGVKVLDHMHESSPEQLIELAARRCYKSFDVGLNENISKVRENSEEYLENILKQRHGSVLAHATCTFAIEDCSRVFTHEEVRNSIGAAFSQESLRYVRLTDIPIWLPPEIDNDPLAKASVIAWIRQTEQLQQFLVNHYAIDEMKDFNKKKQLTSSFRRFSAAGVSTGMVHTFNIRSLRWWIEQRSDRHAEVEMRLITGDIAKIAMKEWPFLFNDFKATLVEGLNEWKPTYSKV